jgi:zinc transport system substrate-binding protein
MKKRIQTKIWILSMIAMVALLCVCPGCSGGTKDRKTEGAAGIVTSDTLLSGMIASLLPADRYIVEAILPPGQCPGHYDVKLSDIEKIKKAVLTVSFRGISFMGGAASGGSQITVDTAGRNWMAPDSYVYGLRLLADELAKRFPEQKSAIMARREQAIREVRAEADLLIERIKGAGLFGKAVVASSMQKEPLEWMGFRVVAEYGRPEATSTREMIELARAGRMEKAVLVVDNLQSGPDAGRGVAETLKTPRVVLTNFPSENGYLATLKENVDSVIRAMKGK